MYNILYTNQHITNYAAFFGATTSSLAQNTVGSPSASDLLQNTHVSIFIIQLPEMKNKLDIEKKQ